MRDVRYLLAQPEHGYRGTTPSLWILVAMTALATGRSLVHVFSSDGGANSIAGLEVSGDAGDNLVHLFAQWGLLQLLLAVVAWVIIARYRFLVPAALLLQVADWGLRSLIGTFKPLVADGTPPGAIATFICVPVLVVALWFSLPRTDASADDALAMRR